MNRLQQTTSSVFPLIPRLIAGAVLTFFSIMHFRDPQHFRDILCAAGFPLVDLSVPAASAAELAAGLLLLSGFFTRIGGILGIATMVPAIIATIKLAQMTVEALPEGLTEIPMVPPLPLPIVVLVTSTVAFFLGGGRLSLDSKMTRQTQTAEPQSH